VLDATLATLAAGIHVAMASLVDRLPPEADVSALFVAFPPVAAATAALVLLVTGNRRLLQGAAVYTWLMVVFTLPAYFLGLAWVPSAVLLTVAALRPGRAVRTPG
jgi:predicted permease